MIGIELEQSAQQEELNFLKEVLNPYVNGEPRGVPLHVMNADALDRQKADQRQGLAMVMQDLSLLSVPGPSGSYAAMQEADRIRRDTVIARLNHKRLMYGCLETAWRRMLKLQKNIDSANASLSAAIGAGA